MTLYHFTGTQFVPQIKHSGISKGAVCVAENGRLCMTFGYQWLTTEPDPDKQSWNTKYLVRYSRTAVRMTIRLPDEMAWKLFDRDGMAKQIPGSEKLFDGWEGSDKWRVYHGIIFPEWIVKLEEMR